MDQTIAIANVIIALFLLLVTLSLSYHTWNLKKISERQIAASLTIAWQNEWHDKQDIKMRQYMMTNDEFERNLNAVIQRVYRDPNLNCKEIEKLMEPAKYQIADLDGALCSFKKKLQAITNVNGSGYNAYDSAERILLSFDRLALVRDVPEAQELIKQYRPVLRYLGQPLQAFITVAYIALVKDSKYKNYKKDFMFLLYKLNLEDKKLFEVCLKALIQEKEVTEKEVKKAKKTRLYT